MTDAVSDLQARIAEHWSKPQLIPGKSRWWHSPFVIRWINRNYCGALVEGTDGGDIELLKQIGGPYPLAVSVGCGAAHHEIQLLRAGLVRHFELYELSETRAANAMERAASLGLEHRITVHTSDAFADPVEPKYDLVYWKDALHHMLGAREAVEWSRDVLKTGGIFFANDFTGETRMQYSDRQMDFAERARAWLPKVYLVHPTDGSQVPLRPPRLNPDTLRADDPSECADSAAILPAIRSVFPSAAIIPTGGVVYLIALHDILANFAEDDPLLPAMMTMDDLCIEAGESLYSVAWARKPEG
jgi:SAM-dependent methyltransferase